MYCAPVVLFTQVGSPNRTVFSHSQLKSIRNLLDDSIATTTTVSVGPFHHFLSHKSETSQSKRYFLRRKRTVSHNEMPTSESNKKSVDHCSSRHPTEFCGGEVERWSEYGLPVTEGLSSDIDFFSDPFLPDLAAPRRPSIPVEMNAEARDDHNTTSSRVDVESMDELDLMVCHEDFGGLVALAEKVKSALEKLQLCESAEAYYKSNVSEKARSSLKPSEVMAVVERMREKLSFNNIIIQRGMYPLTDAIMEDNFTILQKELELCQASLSAAQRAKVAPPGQSEAIAVKYAKWQTDILMNWMIDNKADPFPSIPEIHNLSEMTGLSHSQVINWTTNVRKRNRKATLSGKKPHHFIDFVFLAQDRDDKQKKNSNDKEAKKPKEEKKEQAPTKPPPRKKTTKKRKKPSSSSSVAVKRPALPPPEPSGFPPRPYPAYGSAYPQYANGQYHYYSQPHPLSFQPEQVHPASAEGARGLRSTENWNGHLSAISNSFDEPIEPIFNVDDIDEGPLQDFAQLWSTESFEKDDGLTQGNHMPPGQIAGSDDILAIKTEPNVSDEDTTEDLPPAQLSPPDLNRATGLDMDWQGLDEGYLGVPTEMRASL